MYSSLLVQYKYNEVAARKAYFALKEADREDYQREESENADALEAIRSNPDIRMIARAGKKLSEDQAALLRKYAEYMWPEAFEGK